MAHQTAHLLKYDFTGQVALVTGSSSGIGAAIALQLAQYGAQVVITGRDAANLQKVADKIEEVGLTPLQLIGDLQDQSFAPQLIQKTVDTFGQLDVLVNNAGGSSPNVMFTSADFMAGFDTVMQLNLRSVAQLMHLAVPYLEKTKGNVVNISSVASTRPVSGAYSISKAGLDMLTQTAAQELGPKGIRVNSVSPGPVWTAFGRCVGNANMIKDMEPLFAKKCVLGRIADPEEMANLVSFLASSDARNITGSLMVSDGGFNVSNPLQ